MKKLTTAILVFLGISCYAQIHDYSKALHLSTRFLGAQRSGDTKSWILPEGSGGAFLQDGEAVGRDLSGGWHDCGDYIKFHITGPYTALLYLYGYDKFPEAYADYYSPDYSKAPANGIPDVLDEVKIQTDYLIKTIVGDTVYWQIGDLRDHNAFNEPISQSQLPLYDNSTVRPVYWATEGHSNIFGAAAAALAMMAILYEPFDTHYAQKCFDAALQYYEIGKINPSVSPDAENSAYAWVAQYTDYYDEMGMGAALLYRATQNEQFLTEAKEFAQQANAYASFNYASIEHLLFFELYQITGINSYLEKVSWRVSQYELEDCGYFHGSDWGSLRDAGNAALIAALYHSVTGNEDAYTFAKRNIDFMLGSHDGISGDAPQNFSFLIGYNELDGGYPKHPHHAAAFGKDSNAWALFNQESNHPGSVPYAYELTGGLPGGPESPCANFYDNIANYVSSEYCTYYNAAFNSALAYISLQESGSTGSIYPEINIQNINVYPNPAKHKLHITLAGTTSFAMYNAMGYKVKEGPVFRYDAWDIQNLNDGVYFIKDQHSGWRKKIIVKK